MHFWKGFAYLLLNQWLHFNKVAVILKNKIEVMRSVFRGKLGGILMFTNFHMK